MTEEVRRKRLNRRVESGAVIEILIRKRQTVWKESKDWQLLDNKEGTFGYVLDVVPKEESTVILEQNLPENKFDLAKVIKAINQM